MASIKLADDDKPDPIGILESIKILSPLVILYPLLCKI